MVEVPESLIKTAIELLRDAAIEYSNESINKFNKVNKEPQDFEEWTAADDLEFLLHGRKQNDSTDESVEGRKRKWGHLLSGAIFGSGRP